MQNPYSKQLYRVFHYNGIKYEYNLFSGLQSFQLAVRYTDYFQTIHQVNTDTPTPLLLYKFIRDKFSDEQLLEEIQLLLECLKVDGCNIDLDSHFSANYDTLIYCLSQVITENVSPFWKTRYTGDFQGGLMKKAKLKRNQQLTQSAVLRKVTEDCSLTNEEQILMNLCNGEFNSGLTYLQVMYELPLADIIKCLEYSSINSDIKEESHLVQEQHNKSQKPRR